MTEKNASRVPFTTQRHDAMRRHRITATPHHGVTAMRARERLDDDTIASPGRNACDARYFATWPVPLLRQPGSFPRRTSPTSLVPPPRYFADLARPRMAREAAILAWSPRYFADLARPRRNATLRAPRDPFLTSRNPGSRVCSP